MYGRGTGRDPEFAGGRAPRAVGDGLWVTSVQDPDDYRPDFESPTDLPEETVYPP
jgi:hypothetical protein